MSSSSRGCTRSGARPSDFACSDPDEERREYLSGTYRVWATPDNLQVVANSQVVVLAVPPQAAPQLLYSLRGRIPGGSMVLSVMAGVRLAVLNGLGKHVRVVRAAPNPPVQVGRGFTALAPNARTSAGQLANVTGVSGPSGNAGWSAKRS
ncbi:MAG: NAD(P)-binding domain-containing protein [Bacillota bacterium]